MRGWLSIMLVLFTSAAWAGVPNVLHYQGYLTDSDGAAVHCPSLNDCAMADGLSLTFRLYDQEEEGQPLWTESYETVPVLYGTFNVLLGSTKALDGSLFDQEQLFLGVTINGGEELTPRQRFVSAAFALRADTATTAQDADNLGGVDAADFVTLDEVGGLCVTEEELTAELASKDYCTSCYTDSDVATYLTENGYTAGPGFSGSFADLDDVPDVLAKLTSDDASTLSYNDHPVINAAGEWVGPAIGTGEKGEPGEAGDQGIQGPKGEAGDQGIQGPKGDKGDPGTPGAKGDTGDSGTPGAKGDTGDPGTPGAKGDTGDPGTPGAKGDTGDPGTPGAKGDKGDSCTVADNGDGTKTISCEDGTQVTVTDGAAGNQGDPGTPGKDGGPGADGNVSLLLTTNEGPGAQCKSGGVKVEHGVDIDGDGLLGVEEVQGTATICHGDDATAGGALILPKSDAPPKQCTTNTMGEQYFDAALTSTRTCNGTYWVPALTTCGDGTLGSGEECDDGNQRDGDGCESNCLVATPTLCSQPCVDDNALTAHVETIKLVPSDGIAYDQFGFSSAIQGDRAIVGASYADDKGQNAGAAYVYETQFDGTWQQKQKLLASDGGSDDTFGVTVSIDGDWLVVGAREDDDKGEQSGAAYVFKRGADGTWTEVQKLVPEDGAAGDLFGHAVAIHGDRLLVTASKADAAGIDSGAAYLYERQPNDVWLQVDKLVASDSTPNSWFGWSVAIEGDTVAIGAQLAQVDQVVKGAAYVFERQADGSWKEVAKLLASDGNPNALFGYAVSISGTSMVVGAYRQELVTGLSTGGAYIFDRQADGAWTETQRLLPADGNTLDIFGFSLAMDGSRVVAGTFRDFDAKGSNGAGFVFTRQNDQTWKVTEKVMAVDGADGDYFGWSVAIDGDRLMVGAIHNDDKGDSSGSAYIRTFGALCTKQGVCICQAGYGGVTCNTAL